MSPIRSRDGGAARRRDARRPLSRKHELTLVDRRLIGERVLRVTLSGFDLEGFRYQGGDQRCTLLIPLPAGEAQRYIWPMMMDPWSAASHWGFAAALTRPLRRRLTVSGFRAETLEIDFDILLHGDSPLREWAEGAQLGSTVEIIDNGRRHRVSDEMRWQQQEFSSRANAPSRARSSRLCAEPEWPGAPSTPGASGSVDSPVLPPAGSSTS